MVLIPFFVFGVFINYYYGQLLIKKSEERMTETAVQVAENINHEIRNASIFSSALIHNKEFQQACLSFSNSKSPAESYTFGNELDFHINNLFLYTSNFGSIYVLVKDNKPYEFINYPSQSMVKDSAYIENLIRNRTITNRNIITIENNLFSRNPNNNSPTDPLISLTIYPDEDKYGDKIEAILFSFRLDIIKQLNNITSEQRGIIISDESGQILLSNLDEKKTEQVMNQSEKNWIIANATIKRTNWQIIQASPRQILMNPIYNIQNLFFIFMAGILVIFILYTMLFFHNMITPLNHLAESMNLVKQGEKNVQVELNGPQEMQYLQNTFNRMISQVHLLTEEKQKNQDEKNHLELQALQYQINPHFIANTLNSIRLMAFVSKNEHIKNMTASLMRLINDSFRDEGNHVTLSEEKENLLSYVHIMKVRFGNRIELRFSIPKELEKFKIRKMLIQPLVENSIIHGFNNESVRGIILIQSRIENSKLMLRITDNGIGIDREKDSGNTNQGLTSLGMNSINRRIHLNYGENYGLSVKSVKGLYSSIMLELPVMSGEIHL